MTMDRRTELGIAGLGEEDEEASASVAVLFAAEGSRRREARRASCSVFKLRIHSSGSSFEVAVGDFVSGVEVALVAFDDEVVIDRRRATEDETNVLLERYRRILYVLCFLYFHTSEI